MAGRTLSLAVCAVLSAILCCAIAAYPQGPTAAHPIASTPTPIPVGGISPFPAGCNGNQSPSVNFPNSAVEPYLAVDPRNPEHLVGVWQQDRWSDGCASGLMSAVSMDAGHTWFTSYAHFTICSGGVYRRASDPWSAISPDGTAYTIALTSGGGSGIAVSRSADGGFTWGEPVNIVQHPDGGDDKESMTADPTDAHYVYAVWDRSANGGVAAWFSRSTDGGATWEPARVIYDPGPNGFAVDHQIVVLPDGSLVDLFAGGTYNQNTHVSLLRSHDRGATWSAPGFVADDAAIGTVNPKTQKSVRTGAGIPTAAVDRVSGAIYVVWEDARFSALRRDGIALSKSLDGGLTWSIPAQVNQAGNVQAFTPAVAVGPDGTVAVTYYDFRKDTAAMNTLFTGYFRAVSHDAGATWRETAVTAPFDILGAPMTTSGPFLGDYQGLAASGNLFVAFYVAATGNPANPTSVFADSEERHIDTRINPRIEINFHPRPVRTRDQPEPKLKSH